MKMINGNAKYEFGDSISCGELSLSANAPTTPPIYCLNGFDTQVMIE